MVERSFALFDKKEWPKEQVQEDWQRYVSQQFLALGSKFVKAAECGSNVLFNKWFLVYTHVQAHKCPRFLTIGFVFNFEVVSQIICYECVHDNAS
jgi:hypothetical protein